MTTKLLLKLDDGSTHTYEMRRQFTDVSTIGATEKVPEWRYTDAAGHTHKYDSHGEVPTLNTVTDGEAYYCADCHDEHDPDSRQECIDCGETIRPGRRSAGSQVMRIAGLEEYRIDGEYVTQEEWDRQIAWAKQHAVFA